MSDQNQSLAERYLMGIICNRGCTKRYLIESNKIPSAVHRAVYQTLRRMIENGVVMSPEMVVDKLLHNSDVTQALSPEQVYKFVSASFKSGIPKSEVNQLHDALLRNHIFDRAKPLLRELADRMDSEDALEEALSVIRYLKSQSPEAVVSLEEQMQEAVEEALAGQKGLVKYGIPVLDRHLGGASRGEITIIAGRPGHGKTSFASDLCGNWLDDGLKVLFVSKEMKTFRLIHKMIANKTEFTSRQLHRGEIEESDHTKFKDACAALARKYDGQLFIHDDVYDVHRIETLVAKYQPDVIVDDFIQLTACDDNNMRLEILRIMKQYKQIAKEYNCAVVTLSQLNRSIESREDPVPRLSDLAESGAIEQLAADVLFVYYAHKVDQEASPEQVEIVASKTRYGTTGRFRLRFDGQHMRYQDVPVVLVN